MNTSYIKNTLIITIIVLIAIIGSNYFIDPGAIYYKSGGEFSKLYAKSLIKSDNGLLWSSNIISDRELSLNLSSHIKDTDCVVIGSSHVMQISTYGKPKLLDDLCNTVLNLSVSGGSIEDHLILTYLAIKNGASKKIILGIDPWTLSSIRSTRWNSSSQYAGYYAIAQSEILNLDKDNNIFFTRYLNLINLEYTKRSMSLLLDRINKSDSLIGITHVMKTIDVNNGIDSGVKLPDGSLVYPNSYINMQKKIPISKELHYYRNKLGRSVSSTYLINMYDKILSYIKESDVEPIIIMTPYHENVWKFKGANFVKSMSANENIVRHLGEELGVPVLGSYDPMILGCKSNEFYDFQHATRECLARIKRIK